jgi:Phage gp6-like head-tail connector protein
MTDYPSFSRITTVVAPADGYGLVSLENLKADLGITADTDDDYLTRAIERVSLSASLYCNRVFVRETVQDEFELRGSSSVLYAARFPVIEVDTLTLDGVELVEDVDFRVDSAKGHIYRIDGRWNGETVTVVYDSGFDPIPVDLQGAATEMVKAVQFNRTRDPSLRSENILSGLYAYTLFDPSSGGPMPGSVQQVAASTLDFYKLPALA